MWYAEQQDHIDDAQDYAQDYAAPMLLNTEHQQANTSGILWTVTYNANLTYEVTNVKYPRIKLWSRKYLAVHGLSMGAPIPPLCTPGSQARYSAQMTVHLRELGIEGD